LHDAGAAVAGEATATKAATAATAAVPVTSTRTQLREKRPIIN
jgi:hypothetical protein